MLTSRISKWFSPARELYSAKNTVERYANYVTLTRLLHDIVSVYFIFDFAPYLLLTPPGSLCVYYIDKDLESIHYASQDLTLPKWSFQFRTQQQTK